jgi:hypothetical protein
MNDSTVSVKPGQRGEDRWLLLVHQIPPKPDYFRVKVRRRLQRIGAVALKNSVYLLPSRPEALEDFRWLLREIVADGGEASLCLAEFVEGISRPELEAMFAAERDADYAEIAVSADRLGSGEQARSTKRSTQLAAELGRIRSRLNEVAAIDYFGAPGRKTADRSIAKAEARLGRSGGGPKGELEQMRGQVWVTRSDVFIDRIASAWLIRRFIDPKATFKFSASRTYHPKAGEARFDMYEAEYTHEGDRCTFETLLDRSGLRDRALRAIAEIVHDIDCKDGKFGREEAPGIAALMRGVVRAYPSDSARLERGAMTMDQLYESLRQTR